VNDDAGESEWRTLCDLASCSGSSSSLPDLVSFATRNYQSTSETPIFTIENPLTWQNAGFLTRATSSSLDTSALDGPPSASSSSSAFCGGEEVYVMTPDDDSKM